MSDEKQGWPHSDIYTRAGAASLEKRLPRTSIFKFGTSGDLVESVIRLIAQSLIAWLLFALLLIFLIDPIMRGDGQYYLVTAEIIKVICVTISVFLAFKVFGEADIVDLGLKLEPRSVYDFLMGFALVAVVFFFEFILFSGFGWMQVKSVAWQSQSLTSIFGNMLVMLIVFVFVGWSEELLSRGFHLRIISRGLNRPLGILLSSAIFAYLHHNNPGITWPDYVFIFLFGILATFATLRTGQLWLAMGLHAAWDFCVTVFWGTPISNLRLFRLMDIRLSYFPIPSLFLGILELFVLAILIYFYTAHRQPKIADW